MINIHGEYVTPHIICVCAKLDGYLTSPLNIYGCSIDPCDFVGIRILYRSHPKGDD